MNEYIAIENIQQVIDCKRLIPTILMWNRLEGRPRTKNFDRALKAEMRDALFMLTKQWQMGEFKSDDAGSPAIAKVHMETTRLNKYQASGHSTQPFDDEVPLETKVEQRNLPFNIGDQDLLLDIRLLMGRQWLKMIDKRNEICALRKDFIKGYSAKYPDPNKREDAHICAHPTVWQQYAAVVGRAMDGAKLYFHLKEDTSNHAYDLLPQEVKERLDFQQKSIIDDIGKKFIAWFETLFYQPIIEGENAWLPSKLEYQFACSAPKNGVEKIFVAEEYYHGHLDWYNLNVDKSIAMLGSVKMPGIARVDLEKPRIYSFFPTRIHYEGMPNTRWWTFEEGRTNFGDIKPDTTDLNKLLLMEFGLIYANDWFLVPFTLPAGSIAIVRGMAVINVFGERLWVEPAGAGSNENWQRWSMFTLNVEGAEDEPVDLSLLLLPKASKIQQGQPIEEVCLIRDEMANMVWGIETRILLPSGVSKPGREAALELGSHYQRIIEKENAIGPVAEEEIENKAAIKYQIMNTVPENWIPFIPVHVKNSNREIQLQRAAILRIIKGDKEKPGKIHPRTNLLSVGLEEEPKTAYKLFEEEVPRSGIRIYQVFRRTRWYNGKVLNWLSVHKQTGRGEGSSGLRFDQIVPIEKPLK
jgi:hypothetical protein